MVTIKTKKKYNTRKDDTIVSLDETTDALARHISICIVIPTYNEAQNIGVLLGKIFSKKYLVNYTRNQIEMNVLVVDDNSPDGTAAKVAGIGKQNENVHLLVRQGKQGLGSAYIAGIQYALLNLKPDVVFEMDADLSHDPKYIVPMINELKHGADMVIGSRYVNDGRIPKNWGIYRKFISGFANTYTKIMLGNSSIKDWTGGFRCFKSSILKKINFNELGSKGYVFQISILNAVLNCKGVVKEHPIIFKDRTKGKSKLHINDVAEVGLTVFFLGLQRQFSWALSPVEYEEETPANEFAEV